MTITRGDSNSWRIPLLNEAGGPLNLATAPSPVIVTVTCKARVSDPDEEALFQHFIQIDNGAVTASNGMTVGPGGMAAGIIIERLDPALSATFDPRKYKWDLEVRIGADVHTPLNDQPDTVAADYTVGPVIGEAIPGPEWPGLFAPFDARLGAAEMALEELDDAITNRVDDLVGGGFANRVLTVVGLGDSITDGGSDYLTGVGQIWQNGKSSWLTHLAALSKQRLRVVNNAAVGGDTTTGMLARLATDVIAYQPDMCILLAGANDVSTGVALATTKANVVAIHEQLREAGIALVLSSLTPRDPADATDSTRLARTQELSAWLESCAATNGLRFIDFYKATVDVLTGNWITGYSIDSLHAEQKAAREMGRVAVTTILGAIPVDAGVPLPVSNVDATNVLVNGLMLTDATADGIPDGWAAPAPLTVRTLDTDAAISGKWSTMTASGTAMRLTQAPVTGATGDVFAFMGRVKTSGIEAGSAIWDLSSAWLDNGNASQSARYYPLGSDKTIDLESSVFYVQMPPKPALGTKLDVRINIDSGSGSVSWAQVKLVNLTALGLV